MRRRATVVALAACVLLGGLAFNVGAAGAQSPQRVSKPVAIGPLTLAALPACNGKQLQVEVNLHTVTAAVATLTPQSPRYSFDVTVGVSKAKGEITSMFMPAGQLSTTVADVTLSTMGQAPQAFKGLIQSWDIAELPKQAARRADCAPPAAERP